MRIRLGKLVTGVMLALLAGSVLAQGSQELRVSATVPPPPCQFPDPCEPVTQGTASRVTVTDDTVHYVGTMPTVTRKDDLLTVVF